MVATGRVGVGPGIAASVAVPSVAGAAAGAAATASDHAAAASSAVDGFESQTPDAAAVFVMPPKRRGRVPDKDTFLALYLRLWGQVTQIAEFLGVTRMTVYNAIDRFGLGGVLPVRSRRAHPATATVRVVPSNDELAMAFAQHQYNWTAVKDHFGVSHAVIHQRIGRALSNGPSLLKFVIQIQRHLEPIMDDHIKAAITIHQGDIPRAAGFLRMPVDEVLARVRPPHP